MSSVDEVPKAAKNFHGLNTGEKEFDSCARVVTSHTIMALSAKSIYREKFEDEHLILKHPASGPGILPMADAGLNTNDSQFCICITRTKWLHGKHMVFGKMKQGVSIMEAMERCAFRNDARSPLPTVDN
ncbi:hypothetical protein A6R68_11958 [Neotoma lepida]|uniref:Peptidyl-prolyl cis-trans isomerase n=1 Tax=Neotoma lepida TaxID=56216 RepID=A0A1A6FSI4_NEOLE|nr:hypothetical protein A6R68_11958 [Neotoma lepida]